jgi:hypothetical protein
MTDFIPMTHSELEEEIKNAPPGRETHESGQIDTKFRQAHLKHYIGERLKQENRRSALINQELMMMRTGALSPQPSRTSQNYPLTTNQDFINEE